MHVCAGEWDSSDVVAISIKHDKEIILESQYSLNYTYLRSVFVLLRETWQIPRGGSMKSKNKKATTPGLLWIKPNHLDWISKPGQTFKKNHHD